jgi:hypothetical protein
MNACSCNRKLPLQEYEVLEQELGVPNSSTWEFSEEHLRKVDRHDQKIEFCQKLNDYPSFLSKDHQKSLDHEFPLIQPGNLLPYLNRLLSLPLLDHVPENAPLSKLRAKTEELLKLELEGADLEYRNRLFLEDLFPDFLLPIDQIRLEKIYALIHSQGRTALCLSGGGIRSATFSLGVLQGLARCGLLERFDYLSTVSGGGYVGSWLSAWIKRSEGDLDSVARQLRGAKQSDRTPEAQPVSHLRSFSNYLSPKLGFFSADVWTLVVLYLRNLIINWAVIIPFLMALLIIPRICVAVVRWHSYDNPWWPFWIALCLSTGVIFGGYAIAYLIAYSPSVSRENRDQRDFLRHCIFPLILFAVSITTVWAWYCQLPTGASLSLWYFIGFSLGINVVGSSLAAIHKIPMAWKKENVRSLLRRVFSADSLVFSMRVMIGGVILGMIAHLLAQPCRFLDPIDHPDRFVCLAAPLFFLLFLLVSAIAVVGVSSRYMYMDEQDREWLARSGSWIFILAIIWSGFSSLVFYGPELVSCLNKEIHRYVAASGGILVVLYSLYMGHSSATAAKSNNEKPSWNTLLLNFSAPLSLLFIFTMISLGTSTLINLLIENFNAWRLGDPASPTSYSHFVVKYAIDWLNALFLALGYDPVQITHAPQLSPHMAAVLGANFRLVAGLFMFLNLIGFLMARLIDLNKFSLNSLYQNRLIRAYLGASNLDRTPNAFTGFDENDNLEMSALSKPSQKLFHIVNTTLNLVGGEKLAWQERKAASFVITPLHVGSHELGYRHSSKYALSESSPISKSITLGTAISLSGAAVSPNMGYSSSSVAALLLTLFNIRLGAWLGNTGIPGSKLERKKPVYQTSAPRNGLRYFVEEALGLTNEKSSFVYLSDGGHFENLGLYEMVRRRCNFIVVVDAGCDPAGTFEDLGNAIRKINIDMGIPITFNGMPIYSRKAEAKPDAAYCAIGNIDYRAVDGDNAGLGTLIYLKPAFYGSEPMDVRQYGEAHLDFPHESTADQWFSESQFESYRQLGRHVAATVFDVSATSRMSTAPSSLADRSLSPLITELRQRWYPASRAIQESFTRHADTVNAIFDLIRGSKELQFLDAQIYPEWQHLAADYSDAPPAALWLPKGYDQMRAGFYVCNQMIQLMESVYLDLHLEQEFEHPDNRGWMNLFKHWSWSGMFRVTYAISASTYGARFQSFCERRLDLGIFDNKDIIITPLDVGATGHAHVELNFLENQIVNTLRGAGKIMDTDQILSLQFRVADPRSSQNKISFAFGMAIVSAGGEGGKRVIRYLRIRDHLRKMGWGRKALSALLDPTQGLNITNYKNIPPKGLQDMPERMTPESDNQFSRLFDSVKARFEKK